MGVIDIVGCGPGGREHLTFGAWDAIRKAQVRIGSERILSGFRQGGRKHLVTVRTQEVLAHLRENVDKRCAVLVSGDPGVCSLARPLVEELGLENVRIHPGISSLQLAAARLGMDWGGARLVSHHVAENRGENPMVTVLGGGPGAQERTAQLRARLGDPPAWLCRNLSLPDEEVRRLEPGETAAMDGLSVLVLRADRGATARSMTR